jgi:hypothetical protein
VTKVKPDRLLRVTLILTAVTMIVVWLPFIRGLMDGPSYEWGSTFLGKTFGGKGVGGQYWLIVIEAVVAIGIVFLGWRGAGSPFHWLLLIWNLPAAVNAFYNAINFPEDYRFKGDTLGVDVSVAWIGPVFWGILAVMSIFWVWRDLKSGRNSSPPTWTRTNTIFLGIVIALLPVQFLLLHFGGPTDIKDPIGVILTMIQWIILNLSFVSWRSKLSDP